MSTQLYELAVSGDFDRLLESLDNEDPDVMTTFYQWLRVAQSVGHEEAGDIADSLYETDLSGDDAAAAELHFEIAAWFILGEEDVTRDSNKGLDQLEIAQTEFGMRDVVELDEELRALRSELTETDRQRFDLLFPAL